MFDIGAVVGSSQVCDPATTPEVINGFSQAVVKVWDLGVGWVLGAEAVPLGNQGPRLSRYPRSEIPPEASGDVTARHLTHNTGKGRRSK